jgi:hypothetical protein
MLLKVIRQPLGTAKRIQKSRWEMPKDYWIASRQFLEGIGNAQIPTSANRKQGRMAQQLLAKTWQFPSLFSEATYYVLRLYLLKVKGTVENFKNPQRVFSYFCSFHPYHF